MNNEIYRDRSEGANARRLDLLRKRRDELITMPHAVRRVFVARSARIAASLAICAFGVAMLATAALPPVTRFLEGILPGAHPAAFSQLLLGTWVVALCVYAMARSRSEHRFIVAMSKYVLPGEDVDHDIERLSHEHPDAMAKRMAEKLEVRSAALPVMAAALVLPATAIYIVAALIESGWATSFEERIAANTLPLVAIGSIGIALGLVMKRRFARLPIVAPIAGFIGVVALAGALVGTFKGITSAWLVAPAVLGLTIATIVRRLRIERTLIDAVDPAAGSELFSWRKSLGELRQSITSLPSKITRPMAYSGLVAAALFVLGGSSMPGLSTASTPMIASVPSVAMPSAEDIMIKVDTKGMPIARASVPITVYLQDGRGSDVYGIAGFETLPRNWKMKVVVSLAAASNSVMVMPFASGSATKYGFETDAGEMVAEMVFHACGDVKPLGFKVTPQHTNLGTQTVELSVMPKLWYEPCDE